MLRQTPIFEDTGMTTLTIDVQGDWIVVGRPDLVGGSRVHILHRNAGGQDQWEPHHVIIPTENGLDFGSEIIINGSDLFIGGFGGVWRYSLHESDAPILIEEIDTANCRAMMYVDPVLFVSGPVVANMNNSIVKRFALGSDNSYHLEGGYGFSGSGMALWSCPGEVVLSDLQHLIVANPCYGYPLGIDSITGEYIPKRGQISMIDIPTYSGSSSDVQSFGVFGINSYSMNGDGYGRSLALKGDTLFVGCGTNAVESVSSIDVFVRDSVWALFSEISAPLDVDSLPKGDIGHAIVSNGTKLYVGTEVGLAFYQENDTGWTCTRLDTLGGPVTDIALDGANMAVAVPSIGKVFLYEDVSVGVGERGHDLLELQAYPNPGSDKIQFRPSGLRVPDGRMDCYDVTGRHLWSGSWDGGSKLTLDRCNGCSGMTYYQWIDTLGKIIGRTKVIWLPVIE